MLKLFFCILAILVGGYVGVAKSAEYKNRVAELNDCELFLSRLKTYMTDSKLSTKELFISLAKADSLNKLTFIKSTALRLESEPNFPAAFKECIEASKKDLALKDEDYIPIINLCELLGSYDTQEVITGIDLSAELIKQSQKEAEFSHKTNGKLSRSLGILGGVAVAILIL